MSDILAKLFHYYEIKQYKDHSWADSGKNNDIIIKHICNIEHNISQL